MMDDGSIERKGNTYTIPYSDVTIQISDKILMISNDDTSINAFSKGGNGHGIENVASEARNGNYLYLNLDIDDYPSELTREMDKSAQSLIGGYLKQAQAKLTDSNSIEIVVSLQNDSKNSLLYTLEYIDENLTRIQKLF